MAEVGTMPVGLAAGVGTVPAVIQIPIETKNLFDLRVGHETSLSFDDSSAVSASGTQPTSPHTRGRYAVSQ